MGGSLEHHPDWRGAHHRRAPTSNIYIQFKEELLWWQTGRVGRLAEEADEARLANDVLLVVEAGWQVRGMHPTFVYVWKCPG